MVTFIKKTWAFGQHCPGMEGFYLHLEECRPCIEGSICPGSSEIEILPGFFSSKDRAPFFGVFPGTPERCAKTSLFGKKMIDKKLWKKPCEISLNSHGNMRFFFLPGKRKPTNFTENPDRPLGHRKSANRPIGPMEGAAWWSFSMFCCTATMPWWYTWNMCLRPWRDKRGL